MLPTTVTIMGIDIQVLRPEEIVVEGESVLGSYDEDQQAIEVQASLKESDAMSTLVHEMAHAWLRLSSMTEVLNLDEQREEGLVLSFERHFMPAIAKVLGSSIDKSKRKTKLAAKRGKK